MHRSAKKFDNFFQSQTFLIFAFLSIPLGYLWHIHASESEIESPTRVAVLALCILIFLIAFLYSYKVRRKNNSYKLAAREIHEISNIYKSAINIALNLEEAEKNNTRLLELEERVLAAVCRRISRVFEILTERGCVVTLKLVTEESGNFFAHTFVRSEDFSRRDSIDEEAKSLDENSNTALVVALKVPLDSSKPPHYFSADLLRESNFKNSRADFFHFYRSTLVVPICSDTDPHGVEIEDLVGYLCVDTLSINRLNDSEHLYLLSSFSNQIFNFMSILSAQEAK